jgi:crotonobetainyl-CoA:carnitine CoA-transferase CaiB-like acyl-CoA transferase
MTTALEGLRVLELSTTAGGAMAGMVLADNGAEVIKVEPPAGDPTRADPGFLVWNRGKRSVVIDLATPEGRHRVLELVATADAVIESLSPGAAERLGVDHHVLEQVNPGIVYGKITGFGERGPLRDLPGDEYTVAAVSGRMASQAALHRDGPTFTPAPIATFGAAMLCVQGVLAALLERTETGLGQRAHTSLLHSLVAYDMTSGHGHRIHQQDDSGKVYGVMPLAFMTAECKDGRFIQMCSRMPHLYRSWMRALDLEHLYDDPAMANMPDVFPSQEALDEVVRLVKAGMLQRTSQEWLELFAKEDIGANPFLSPQEFLQCEQARVTGRVVEVDDPTVGRTTQIGPLAIFSETPSAIGVPAPPLGADDDVLSDVGSGPPRARAGSDPAAVAPGGIARRGPLDGITIIEAGYAYATPFSATLLAEMGARVIKVEGPTGDIARRNWTTGYIKETPNKECVVLDLKLEEGREVLHRMVRDADVFLHNFRPGVPERLGIDDATLRGINPRLIYAYGSCYGSTGPWAELAGFHSSPNAIGGVGAIECGEGNPPQNRTYGDPTGALSMAVAMLLALHARERTGAGQYVETTMLSSLAYAISGWSLTYDGKPADPLPDHDQRGFGPLCRLYETGDGWLFLGCYGAEQRTALAAVLERQGQGLPAELVGADADGAALVDALAARFATAPADEWERLLLAAGVAGVRADRTSLFGFMLDSEQMRINRLSILDELPEGGEYWRSTGSVEFSRHATREGRPEQLSESTERVLRGLGYDDEALAALAAKGVTTAVGDGLPRGGH